MFACSLSISCWNQQVFFASNTLRFSLDVTSDFTFASLPTPLPNMRSCPPSEVWDPANSSEGSPTVRDGDSFEFGPNVRLPGRLYVPPPYPNPNPPPRHIPPLPTRPALLPASPHPHHPVAVRVFHRTAEVGKGKECARQAGTHARALSTLARILRRDEGSPPR